MSGGCKSVTKPHSKRETKRLSSGHVNPASTEEALHIHKLLLELAPTYLSVSPTEMVDEREVTSLHLALISALGDKRARTVGWIAGQRTADYLLRHRIPKPAQLVLRAAPAPLASRMLAAAIAKNAWTFAGSGAFSALHGRPTTFAIKDCPICRGRKSATPACDFYAATFERLYSRLVHPRTRVVETGCEAMGAPACCFTISW